MWPWRAANEDHKPDDDHGGDSDDERERAPARRQTPGPPRPLNSRLLERARVGDCCLPFGVARHI
jgi:hypothetical protein